MVLLQHCMLQKITSSTFKFIHYKELYMADSSQQENLAPGVLKFGFGSDVPLGIWKWTRTYTNLPWNGDPVMYQSAQFVT